MEIVVCGRLWVQERDSLLGGQGMAGDDVLAGAWTLGLDQSGISVPGNAVYKYSHQVTWAGHLLQLSSYVISALTLLSMRRGSSGASAKASRMARGAPEAIERLDIGNPKCYYLQGPLLSATSSVRMQIDTE